MGRRGPKRELTSLKLIKGNPGKRTLNTAEPQLSAPKASKPPTRLEKDAADEWIRLYAELVEKGVLTEGDLSIFEEYCYTLGELRKFERLAQKYGAETSILKGFHKATITLRSQLRQLAGDLGLTPASRSGVKAIEAKKQESKLEKFVRPDR
jgi:P27 family predicted phage terminase small subunit